MATEGDSPSEGQWPFAEFNEFLDRRMQACGIPSRHQLAQRSAIPAQTLSNWWRGTAQPTLEMLDRLAPVLGASRIELWIRAGRITRDELIIDVHHEQVPASVRRAVAVREQVPTPRRGEFDIELDRFLALWSDRCELERLRRREAAEAVVPTPPRTARRRDGS